MMARQKNSPLVGVVMGSDSDWDIMEHAVLQLTDFGVPYEAKVLSAHRTPDAAFAYAESAASRGLAKTILPVLGVPMPSKYLRGEDSLLSTVQMPKGIPVATFAIGEAGAANAALFAIAWLARGDPSLAARLADFRAKQTAAARAKTLPPKKK